MTDPKVSIIMGSDSDLPVMRQAADVLKELKVPFELTIVSAHRTPERMFEFAKNAHTRGIKTIIAGAGGAAHLPGMVASLSPLPVIGVPIKSSNSIDGWDSVLSILQMPGGVPVATLALNGAKNAGILAAQIIASHDENLLQNVINYKKQLAEGVAKKYTKLEQERIRKLFENKSWNNKKGFDIKSNPFYNFIMELIKIQPFDLKPYFLSNHLEPMDYFPLNLHTLLSHQVHFSKSNNRNKILLFSEKVSNYYSHLRHHPYDQ